MDEAWHLNPSGGLALLMRFGHAEMSCGAWSIEYSRGGTEDTSGVCCLVAVGSGGVFWLLGGVALRVGEAWSFVAWSSIEGVPELCRVFVWSAEGELW